VLVRDERFPEKFAHLAIDLSRPKIAIVQENLEPGRSLLVVIRQRDGINPWWWRGCRCGCLLCMCKYRHESRCDNHQCKFHRAKLCAVNPTRANALPQLVCSVRCHQRTNTSGQHEHATSLRTADTTALVVTRRRIRLAKSIGLESRLQPLPPPRNGANRLSKVFPIDTWEAAQAKARKQALEPAFHPGL
jgi:hypothetical protein